MIDRSELRPEVQLALHRVDGSAKSLVVVGLPRVFESLFGFVDQASGVLSWSLTHDASSCRSALSTRSHSPNLSSVITTLHDRHVTSDSPPKITRLVSSQPGHGTNGTRRRAGRHGASAWAWLIVSASSVHQSPTQSSLSRPGSQRSR